MINISKSVQGFSKIQHLSLYYEDLLEIESFLNSASGKPVRISFNTKDNSQHDVTSLDEIPLDSRLDSLTFSLEEPRLTVTISRSYGLSLGLYGTENDKTYALSLKVLSLVSRHESKLRKFLTIFSFYIGFFIFLVVSTITSYLAALKNPPELPTWLGMSILVVALLSMVFIVLGFSMMSHRSKITLGKRGAANLLSRNRDSILTGIIVAVFTLIITKIFKIY